MISKVSSRVSKHISISLLRFAKVSKSAIKSERSQYELKHFSSNHLSRSSLHIYFYSSLNLLYFNYLLRGVYFHSSKRILGEPSETKLKTSLFSDCTCTSIFLRSCWTRYDSCTLMISRRMVWKRRRTSQARAYFCRIRAFCSTTIYNNTDSNVWLCDQGQKIIMKRQTMWLCLSVALAGQPSSGEGLYGDYSPQDELVNPPHQIATTVSLNHHRSPGLLQQQSGHSASAAEKFLMYSKCSVWWKRTFLHFICAIL